MFCPRCGNETNPSANYCTECGCQIKPSSEDKESQNEKSKNEVDSKPTGEGINWYVGIILVVISIIISQILSFVLGLFSVAVPFVSPEKLANQSYGTAESLYLILTVSSFGITSLIYMKYRSSRFAISMSSPDTKQIYDGLIGLTAATFIYLIYTTVINVFEIQVSSTELFSFAENSVVGAVGLSLISLLLVAPSEELFHRGVLQGGLSSEYGSSVGLWLSSSIFALIHIPNFLGTDILVLAITIIFVYLPIGLIFGYLYQKTGNLAVPILVHGLYNSLVAVLTYLLF